MASSQQEILNCFLLQTFLKWKSAKDNVQDSWIFSRCCRCKLPLFSNNFIVCLSCNETEDEEEARRQKCVICGDDADGGPIPIVCSRSCLRIWNGY